MATAQQARSRKNTGKKTTDKKVRGMVGVSKSRKLSAVVLLLVVAGFAGLGVYLLSVSHASTCIVSDKLVNSCRPWLGAAADGYGVSGYKNNFLAHENRIGRQLDIVHTYHPVTSSSLSADEKYFITRPNDNASGSDTILLANWKPADTWADASGSNATVNARIDSMAESIKSMAPHKIMLSIWHEPENDVSRGGSPGCTAAGVATTGKAGTTAQYRAMWSNVQKRFKAKGVDNVVWTMIYMGYAHYNCMDKELWPGADNIDWVMWDPYNQDGHTWSQQVSSFYDWLTANSASGYYDFNSKPWGLSEWGSWQTHQSDVYASYEGTDGSAKTALDTGAFPNLKAYVVWDNYDSTKATARDSRLAYSAYHVHDLNEQAAYNIFAADPRFTDEYYVTHDNGSDTTAPTVSITAPKGGATVHGTVTISGSAHDNTAVTAVILRVDGSWVATKDSAPYTFSLNTKQLSNGKHTVVLRAWDGANNHTDATITIRVKN